jgi:predicted N-acyltransferase
MSDSLIIDFLDSINQVDANSWNQVVDTDYPFIQYEFLSALEQSGATTAESGWQPFHLVVKNDHQIVAIMPLYIKQHSYGEYVFDHAWADAYYRNGLDYYPKLVSAIPFTPSVGQRVYFHKSIQQERGQDSILDDSIRKESLLKLITQAIQRVCHDNQISSWHLLFGDDNEMSALERLDCFTRVGVQYHWFNRDSETKPYQNFDGFLANCKAKSRKSIKRERRLIREQAIGIKWYEGSQITPELWQQFYRFYEMTYLKRSGHSGYLNQAFFELLAESFNQQTLIISAEVDQTIIAAALYFKDNKTLYGRYWGCLQELNCLHFELCYYQGIEYCIKHGITRFDAGAQGEHKIPRGFKPIKTYSSHWVAEPNFVLPLRRFVKDEAQYIEQLLPELAKKLPLK